MIPSSSHEHFNYILELIHLKMNNKQKQPADRPRVDPLGDLKIAEARGKLTAFESKLTLCD